MSPLFSNVSTTLDLNGPTLSFVRDPVGQVTNVARGKVKFVGIATATFPSGQTSRNTNTGYIKYQWYQNGNALQDNDTTVVGSATTTLSIRGLISPNDDNQTISLVVDYIPSAYQDVDSDGVLDLTGNAINDPIETNAVILSVLPTISITSQPTKQLVNEFDPDIIQGVATDQSDVEATFTVSATTTNIDDPDPSVLADGTLLYSWWVEVNGTPFELSKGVPDRFFVSNPTLPSITIKKDFPGRHLVYCVVSHTTADPESIQSSKVEFEVRPSRGIISYERISNTNQVISVGNRNLSSAGKLEFQADPEIETNPTPSLPKTPSQNTIVLYAPERDVVAKVTMGGARGEGFGENAGGNGGVSIFKMTFKKNEEYVVRLGVNDTQGFGIVGGSSELGGGGGGMSVLYHKARVIAVCGGGGGAGQAAPGGDGGGVDTDGADGSGPSSGIGGQKFNTDTLPSDGSDNNGTAGGILGGCSEGNHYNTQGLTPCTDIATTRIKYVDKDGNEISDSALIIRGYKAGQGYRDNGGDAEVAGGYQGAGGAGARGGNAASANNSGGGGGSGYQSSEIELLNSFSLDNTGNILLPVDSNRLGGNNDVGFITIEEFVDEPSNEYRIEQPQASVYNTSSITAVLEKQVNFDIERDSFLDVTMTLERIFGLGPKTITFGPNTDLMETVLGENAVYRLQSALLNTSYTLRNNTVQIDGDGDGIYNDLSITPNKGRFNLNQENVLEYIADWNEPENQEKTLDRPSPIITFDIDVDSIDRHTPDEATLSWSITGYNVTDIEIDNGIGSVIKKSTQSGTTYSGTEPNVDPLNTTTYTLTAKNSNGTYFSSISTATKELIVNNQRPVIINFFEAHDNLGDNLNGNTSTSLTYNNPGRTPNIVTLNWDLIGEVKSIKIRESNGTVHSLESTDTRTFDVTPPTNATTVYTLIIENLDGILSPEKTISIIVNNQLPVEIESFTTSDNVYHHPGATAKTVTLSWSIGANESDRFATNDVSTIIITDNDGNTYSTDNSTSGSITVTPPKSNRGTNVVHPSEPTAGTTDVTTYTLTATNVDGLTTTDALNVTVLNQEHNDVTLSVSPSSVQNFQTPNESVTLSWTIAGDYTRFDVINDQTNAVVATSGSSLVVATPLPTNTNTYRIKVYNRDFVKEEKQVSFSVDAQDPNTITLSAVGPTSSSTSATYNNTSAARTFLSWNVGGITTSIKLEKSFNGGAYQTVQASVSASETNFEIDSPTGTTVYKITAVAGGGVITSSETITVDVEPQLPVSISVSDFNNTQLSEQLLLNSTSLQTSGLANAVNWSITGDIGASNSVVVKRTVTNTNSTTVLTTNTNTGSYSIPASDFALLTPGQEDNTFLSYIVEATNLDGIVSSRLIRYRLRKQPPVRLELSVSDPTIFLQSKGIVSDESTTLTADVSATQGGTADVSSLTIDNGIGSVTSGQEITISPKETITYKATATNIDGIVSTAERNVTVDQNANVFSFSFEKTSVQIPFDKDDVELNINWSIEGRAQSIELIPESRIPGKYPGKVRRAEVDFGSAVISPSGTATVIVDQDVYAVNVRVTNFLGEKFLDYKLLDVSKAPPPEPFVRYYLLGISRFHTDSVGHKFSHVGQIPGQRPEGSQGPNYFYSFHKRKRPDSIHIAVIDNVDNENRYAWKGPGWDDGRGGTYGRLTERPTHTTGLYKFVKANGNVFYTHNPNEAAGILNSQTWTYSKDSNGNLAPRYWIYQHSFYWSGKLTYALGDTFSFQQTYTVAHSSDGPKDTSHNWWKDTTDRCVAIAYVDLGIQSDTFGAEPTTMPYTDDVETRRAFITPDARRNNCYPADHAFKANIGWEKPTSLPFEFTAKTTSNVYSLVYKLLSGFGPDNITFDPTAVQAPTSGQIQNGTYIPDKGTIVPDIDYEVVVECKGKRGEGNGGNGGIVRATFTMKKGQTYKARVGNVGAIFYGDSENVNNCILLAAEGGQEGKPADFGDYFGTDHPRSPNPHPRGGDAGYPTGSAGENLNNSTGGGGGFTNNQVQLGYKNGTGGAGGVAGFSGPYSGNAGQAGGVFRAGAGGWGADGSGGRGGEGYYGGGGGGGGWDKGYDAGGYFGGGGGGGSSYLGGLPPTSYSAAVPAEVVVTNATHSTGTQENSSVQIISATPLAPDAATVGQIINVNISPDSIYKLDYLTISSGISDGAGGLTRKKLYPSRTDSLSSDPYIKKVGTSLDIANGAMTIEVDNTAGFFSDTGNSFNVP